MEGALGAGVTPVHMKQLTVVGFCLVVEILIPAIALAMSDAVTAGVVLVGVKLVVVTERERGFGTGLDVGED